MACEAPKQQVHQCTHICQKVGPSTVMPMAVRSNSAYKLIRQPSFFPLSTSKTYRFDLSSIGLYVEEKISKDFCTELYVNENRAVFVPHADDDKESTLRNSKQIDLVTKMKHRPSCCTILLLGQMAPTAWSLMFLLFLL